MAQGKENMQEVALPQELLDIDPELLRQEIDVNRGEHFPSKSFVPNIGQERALKCYQQKHPVYKDYPRRMFFFGGNGVGKTADMSVLIVGCTLGPEFLNPEYFNHQYFHDCKEIRRKRKFKLRIVCNKADMEETGSVYGEIVRWIPIAQFKGKTSGGYYTKIIIPAPSPEFKETIIDIKTHDMAITAHAGPTLDLIIFNEPPDQGIYAENEARTRGGGRLAAFLTPLYLAAYMHKIINSDYPEGEVYHCRASIWDNCADIIGNRGILSRREIEAMIRGWKAVNPLEVPAREEGRFMHLAGAVFKIFNQDEHVIDPEPVVPSWNVYQIVDHHPHKPACSVWIAVTSLNMIYVIAEYPVEPWDQINGTTLSIKNFGQDFKRIENGRHPNFGYIQSLNIRERIGDPNAFKAQQPHNRKTIKQQYEWDCGLEYNINVDNDIQLRHDKLRDLLRYNPQEPIDSMNTPHLFIYRSCKNMIRAVENYSYRAKQGIGQGLSDKLEEAWKDWIDVLGYGVVTIDPWSQNSKSNEYNDDYMEILRSRDPRFAPKNEEFEEEDVFEPNYIVGRF